MATRHNSYILTASVLDGIIVSVDRSPCGRRRQPLVYRECSCGHTVRQTFWDARRARACRYCWRRRFRPPSRPKPYFDLCRLDLNLPAVPGNLFLLTADERKKISQRARNERRRAKLKAAKNDV